MPLMSQPSSAAKTSLAYITIGALVLVWTAVWHLYLRANPEEVLARTWYLNYGLLGTGVVLLAIGLAVGQIGRSARHAELPPQEVERQEARIDQAAAARPVVMMPGTAPVTAEPARRIKLSRRPPMRCRSTRLCLGPDGSFLRLHQAQADRQRFAEHLALLVAFQLGHLLDHARPVLGHIDAAQHGQHAAADGCRRCRGRAGRCGGPAAPGRRPSRGARSRCPARTTGWRRASAATTWGCTTALSGP